MSTPSIQETTRGEYVEVDSATTPGVTYRVYPDQQRCTCPARGRCWHLDSLGMGEMTGSYCPSCRGYGTIESYPKLAICARCSGTGVIRGAND